MAEASWTVTGPETIELEGVRSLRLGIIRGRFDIATGEDDHARIEVSSVEGDPLAVSLVDGRLEIRHQLHGPQGWFKNLMRTVNTSSSNSVLVSVTLPAGIDVEAGTVSGDGMVAGTGGHTRLNTVSGSIFADDTSGELSINTVSGGVIARNHRGVLTARSVSGDVAASGEITNIRANTVSGDVSFDLHGFTRDVGANAVSGDVTVRVPHDVGVDIIAKSGSGTVVIDGQKYPHPGGAVETIAGPDAQLMLFRSNSVSGTTSILHREPAPDAG